MHISDEENIAIMHAFVDMMEFKDLAFVDALRTFLQAFRLPGEAQKIDRFMLKFAERYIAGNSQTPFANAGECTAFGLRQRSSLTLLSRCGVRSGVLCHPPEHGRTQSASQTSNDTR